MQYVGGKRRLGKYILPEIRARLAPGQLYVEPFVGGANVMDSVAADRRWANDSSVELIALWKAVVEHGWDPPFIHAEEYKWIQDHKSEYDPAVVGWAGYGCSFRGKYFGGYARIYWHSYWNRWENTIVAAQKILKTQRPKLKDVSFTALDYREMDIPDGALVYCDPPYINTLGYRDTFDHVVFWQWVRELGQRCTVLVSESVGPDDIPVVWQGTKSVMMSNTNSNNMKPRRVEQLFCVSPETV